MIDAILLKPNMILPGLDAPVATPEDVAKYTVRTMLRSIPPAVPGIHFLSGGMSEEESTLNLQARPSNSCVLWVTSEARRLGQLGQLGEIKQESAPGGAPLVCLQ